MLGVSDLIVAGSARSGYSAGDAATTDPEGSARSAVSALRSPRRAVRAVAAPATDRAPPQGSPAPTPRAPALAPVAANAYVYAGGRGFASTAAAPLSLPAAAARGGATAANYPTVAALATAGLAKPPRAARSAVTDREFEQQGHSTWEPTMAAGTVAPVSPGAYVKMGSSGRDHAFEPSFSSHDQTFSFSGTSIAAAAGNGGCRATIAVPVVGLSLLDYDDEDDDVGVVHAPPRNVPPALQPLGASQLARGGRHAL